MWRGTQPLGSAEEPHGSHQEGRTACVLVDFITTIDAHHDLREPALYRSLGRWAAGGAMKMRC